MRVPASDLGGAVTDSQTLGTAGNPVAAVPVAADVGTHVGPRTAHTED